MLSLSDSEVVNKTIAVDLDGVLAQYDGWKGPEVIGDVMPGADDFMWRLKKKGYRLIVHTARVCPRGNEGYTIGYLTKVVESWLDKNDIAYDEVWKEVGKPPCGGYIDDRCVTHKGENFAKSFGSIIEMVKGAK